MTHFCMESILLNVSNASSGDHYKTHHLELITKFCYILVVTQSLVHLPVLRQRIGEIPGLQTV